MPRSTYTRTRRFPFLLAPALTVLAAVLYLTPANANAEPATTADPSASQASTPTQPYMPGAINRGSGGANVHGYAEMHVNQGFGQGSGFADFHRFIFGLDFEFHDRIRFGSEIELEHAFVPSSNTLGGELELEQAWLQFDLLRGDFSLSITAGIVIIPFGRLNLVHEPTTFFSVERPSVTNAIIPTTWFDPGVQLSGSLDGGITFVLGVYAGLQARGFTAGSGIRNGRQKGNSLRFTSGADGADLTGLMFAARVDWESAFGLNLGCSGFASRADQQAGLPSPLWVKGIALDLVFTPPVDVLEACRITATFGYIHIDKAGQLNTALGNAPNSGAAIAEKLLGWYAEFAINAFYFWKETDTKLWVFIRYEDFDTQHKMPDGFLENRQFDRSALVCGIAFFPVPNVAVKLTYTDFQDARGTVRPNDQLDFGIGFEY